MRNSSKPNHESPDDAVTDLVRGLYRRIYAGFIGGRRINAVSLAAEAWFWRLNAIADDFGNGEAEPQIVFNATVGRRGGVSVADVEHYLAECASAGLIRLYVHGDDHLFHVVGFDQLQPAGRNGKRVRRFPASPWDETNGASGESGGIQNYPGASSAPIPIPIPIPTPTPIPKKDKPAAQASAATADAATAAAADSLIILTFPVIKKKKSDPDVWPLTQDHIDELAETFPGVDVPSAARHALQWARDNPRKRKTPAGMRRFLLGWMEREQNNPRRIGVAPPNGNGAADRVSPARARMRELLDARIKK